MKVYAFYSFRDTMTTTPAALLPFIATLLASGVRGKRDQGAE